MEYDPSFCCLQRTIAEIYLDRSRGSPDTLWNDNDNPLPDLLLTVDFGQLAAFHRPPGTNDTLQRESLKVYSALTNITEDVFATTRPTLLFPGMNLVGVVNPVMRRQFRAPGLSVLGLLDVSPLTNDGFTMAITMSADLDCDL